MYLAVTISPCLRHITRRSSPARYAFCLSTSKAVSSRSFLLCGGSEAMGYLGNQR